MNTKKHCNTDSMFQRRMIVAFVAIVLVFLGLGFKLGWIQVIKTNVYAARAQATQTKSQIIPARRGVIFDSNMKELAISSGSYDIYVQLKPYDDSIPDPNEQAEQRKKATELLSSVLGTDKTEIADKLKSDNYRVRIASSVDKNKIKLLRQGLDEKSINIIEVEENVDRDYPMGTLASHVLGYVGKDGTGLAGIELQYNDYLSGKAGRRVVNTDGAGNPLAKGETTIATDGSSVVLTLDETIQYYVENAIKKAYMNINPDGIEALVLNPKTGDVLAMASYPDFDPNNFGKPVDKKQLKEFAKLDAKGQSDMMNKIWRNPLVCDLYEPASVFKLITTSSGIESGAITTGSKFNCNGIYHVVDTDIRCWVYPGAHGTQTVKQAVGNSCNPAMIQIIQRMGYDNFHKQLELFGITAPTGIDYPGEASPMIQDKEKTGPVGLATMAFGMGLNLTPVQMGSAISAIVNGGNLMQPRLVKALADENGNITEEFSPKITRKVLSEKTSAEMRDIMEFTVNEAGSKVVKIPGYRIGAKTGTANMLINGEYSKSSIVGTMAAVAPMDDPQFVVLVVVRNPKVGEFGSSTAGPVVREILEEVLRYKSVKPTEEVK